MTDRTLRGVIAAVATIIDANGAPDHARSLKLARFLLDNGCDGLNVLGTTGEATSFSREERMGLMSAYREQGLPMQRLMVGHWRRRLVGRDRDHPSRCRPRLCRRAGAAAFLLQGRAR